MLANQENKKKHQLIINISIHFIIKDILPPPPPPRRPCLVVQTLCFGNDIKWNTTTNGMMSRSQGEGRNDDDDAKEMRVLDCVS